MSKRKFTYTFKLFWIIPIKRSVPKPHIYRSATMKPTVWVCKNGASTPGFGETPAEAWNDWANWALI